MKVKEIRQKFLEFFESKNHKVVPSAPIVIKDDPTLMFTNAGMNQFKDIFLGNENPNSKRAADTQKCLRVSGKHNDLEEVGVDTYHHTMFEMLGNWSFGDYFKKEAIEWSWELLTEVYKINKEDLYITIFEGDKEDNLDEDSEAFDFWKNIVPEDRIIKCDKKDNFWEMGESGPCGPCSEIHIDIRTDEEKVKIAGKDLVNKDHPQVIEIWNLVFIQYMRSANGSLSPLPNKHVDTGMGLERLAVALQGKTSNYDTDVFMPLIEALEGLSNKKYKPAKDATEKNMTNIAFRVIVDHIRAISFCIADGQLPSNTGAGYVIRRILRRAVRYGYQYLGFEEPFLNELVNVLHDQFEEVFPEIASQKDMIQKVVLEEETSFFRTLFQGLKRIDNIFASNPKTILGKDAFELYDTYGFPFDLTRLIASEKGVEVDEKGFESELQKQKDRSKNATKVSASDWTEISDTDKVEFIGYDHTEAKVTISKYREVEAKGKKSYHLVFDKTPFYAESGGQVGDKGYIQSGEEKISIIDTKKENNLIVHIANQLPSNPNASFEAYVNRGKRSLTCNNHSATHLVHEALRDVLGTHVEQKGSLVNEKYLRFDFSHFSKVTDEEIQKVEQIVNQKIRANIALDEQRNIPIEEAKNMGAMALFGEKYGNEVRVIKFGTSVELCGGTHVKSTGEIGSFKITSESSTAAGIRRIEAITADAADQYMNAQIQTLDEIKELLKSPKNPIKSIQDLLTQNQELNKELESLKKEKAGSMKKELETSIIDVNGIDFIGKKVSLDTGSIKDIAFQLTREKDNLVLVLASDAGGKATATVAISKQLAESKDLHAGNMVRELAKEISGGGGGQPFFATAGGKNIRGLDNVIIKAKEMLS